MRVLEIAPTPFWPAEDRQEALLRTDGAATLEIRSAAGVITVAASAGESTITVPSGPHVTELEVRAGDDEPQRRPWMPGRRWDLVVMPTGHVDVYSSETFDKTPEEHAVMLDTALDLCSNVPGFRYQVENLLPVYEYRQLRAHRFDELVDRAREGRIGVGAQLTGFHHAEATGEELIQGNLALGRRLGVAPNCGYTVDVPHATAQYRQLLAQLGIPRWIYSPNRWPPPRGFYGVADLLRNLPEVGRALAPDGSGVVTWIPAIHYSEQPAHLGLAAADVEETRAALSTGLPALERGEGGEGWPVDVYPLEVSPGDNLPFPETPARLVLAWQARYAWPRIRFGTAADVFDALEGAFEATGIELAEWSGEVGDTWAWIVANQAPLNPIMRDSVRLANGAEVAAAVTSTALPDAVDEVFVQAAKYESHDWWYGGDYRMGIPDLAKAEFARLARAAAARATDQVHGHGALLNPSGVRRHAVVTGERGPGQEAPPELVAAHFDPRPCSWALQIEPPTDSGVVSVRELEAFEASPAGPDAARRAESVREVDANTIENERYRVALGAEGVTSLFDKKLGRELAGEPLGRLRVATPQPEGAGIGFFGTEESAQRDMREGLTTWENGGYEPAGAWSGPVFTAALQRGRAHGSPTSLAVVLYDDVPRVDVTVVVDWDGRPILGRWFVDFCFDLGGLVEARYEVPFGSVIAGTEAPVGPVTLRMVDRWVTLAGDDASVVVASRDCGVVALGDPARTLAGAPLPERPDRPAAFFVLADTGAPSPPVQGGRLVGRFSITSSPTPLPASDATRFAASVADPLLAVGEVAPGWRISPPNVVATVLKPEWDGSGLVLRLVECDGQASEVHVEAPSPIREMLEGRPDEIPLGPIEQPLRLRPYEIRTLILR